MITGQVNTNFLGTDAFQETDIFGITYKSDELEILQRYSVTDSNIDDFLSIKTEESKAAEAVQQSTQSQEDKNYEEFH